jgi:hypothetical protein
VCEDQPQYTVGIDPDPDSDPDTVGPRSRRIANNWLIGVGVGIGIGIEGQEMGFGHENLDVYRTSVEYVGWAYRCDADETRVTRLHPCVRTSRNTQSESIPIPIPTPTPLDPGADG